MSFNVLTDPWVALDDGKGCASYVDILCGARDGTDIVHPRDDVRFFTRMLLSALTQALFGHLVPDARALRRQLSEPLAPDIVEKCVESVKGDFEIVGEQAFLQGPARPRKGYLEKDDTDGRSDDVEDDGVDSLLYDAAKHQLYRGVLDTGVVSVESAVPLLYAAQAFARSGGQGYFPGVRGAPPLTTLVRRPFVRATVWANVLHGERRVGYPEDRDRPWRQDAVDASAPIGLVEGLFWQPLAVRAEWADPGGVCAATGRPLDRPGIRVWRLGGRMRAGKIPFAHPYSPVIVDGKKPPRFQRLSAERPAWAGLGEMLPGVSEDGQPRTACPAPVVEQWSELASDVDLGEVRLLVFEYVTDKASVSARFSELVPLSEALQDNHLADSASARVREAASALRALRSSLFPGKKRRDGALRARSGGREKSGDVTAAFWQRTEPLFWTAFDAKVAHVDGRDAFREGIRRIALGIFKRETSVLDGDPAGLARVVRQEQHLRRELRKLFPTTPNGKGASQ